MLTKTLSNFPSSLNLPHQLHRNLFTSSNLHLRPYPPKFSLIKCSGATTTNSDPPNSQTHIAVSEPEPDGAGAAAPTPGQLFLEQYQSKVASKLVLAANKKKRKKKAKQSGSILNSMASCYGCGAPLQTQEVDAPGYVDSDTYELKRKERNWLEDEGKTLSFCSSICGLISGKGQTEPISFPCLVMNEKKGRKNKIVVLHCIHYPLRQILANLRETNNGNW